MKTFKSHSDLHKLHPDDPAFPVMEELVHVLIDDFTMCACHYHRLPEYMFEHPEVRNILSATD